jgi:DNA-nicking Smr family endonuclease
MSRRRRTLTPDERDLWQRVAATAQPIRPLPKPTKREKTDTDVPEFQPESKLTPAPAMSHVPRSAAQRPETAQPQSSLKMDYRLHKAMTRGKLTPEARLDLHGMTLAEAHTELNRFILAAQARDKRMVLVITGKGKPDEDFGPIPRFRGLLRHQVPQWLTQAPLGGVVMQVVPAHLRHGGMGALYVYLRRRG